MIMRINEILNNQEQLKLWKLINDNVFSVLMQQDAPEGGAQRATPAPAKSGRAKVTPKMKALKPLIRKPVQAPPPAPIKSQPLKKPAAVSQTVKAPAINSLPDASLSILAKQAIKPFAPGQMTSSSPISVNRV
jgi:hypothetical protein